MTTVSLPTPLRRRTTTAAVALLLGLAVAGCDGGGGASPSATSATPGLASDDQLAGVLLAAADLPEGYTPSPSQADPTGSPFQGTCLGEIGRFSDALGFEPESSAQVEYGLDGTAEQGAVTSKVEAYADPSRVAPAFASFADELQTCTSLSATDEDGVVYVLDIAYDDEVTLPGADDQLRLDVTGTITAGGREFPATYVFVAELSGPYLSVVGTYTLGEDAPATADAGDLAAVQAGRVQQLR